MVWLYFFWFLYVSVMFSIWFGIVSEEWMKVVFFVG